MPSTTNVLDEARDLVEKRLAELDEERKRLERALAELGGKVDPARPGPPARQRHRLEHRKPPAAGAAKTPSPPRRHPRRPGGRA